MASSTSRSATFYPSILASSPKSSASTSPSRGEKRTPQHTPDGVPSPERPDVLSDVLSIADDLAEKEEGLFVQFLHEAQKAQLLASSNASYCSIKIFQKVGRRVPTRNTGGDRCNSSLLMIHAFYSKLVVNRKITFHDMDMSNSTLNHMGLVSCLRDFKLIPNLVSKEDVLFIWKLMNLESMKLRQGNIGELTLQQFRSFLARLAVLAYNRDGMKRIILQANTIMPSHKKLVEMLAAYMKLEDVIAIKRIIDERGKQGIGGREKEQYVQKDVKRELRQDLLAKRVGKDMADDGPLARIANTLASKVTGLGVSVNSNKDCDRNKTDTKNVALVGTNENMELESSEEEGSDNDEKPRNQQNVLRGGRILSAAGRTRMTHATGISGSQEDELLKVDPQLGDELERYCAREREIKINEDFEVNDCAYIDLGELEPGQQCTINVIITNKCPDDTQLDVITRGFPSKDIDVLMHPGSFAPGMKRNATISFTVDNTVKDVLAFIDLFMVPVRSLQAFNLSCPVFYRIVQSCSTRLTSLPVLKQSNFAALLQRYCGKSMSKGVTFEKTRDWYSGPKWMQGPNYAQETEDNSKHKKAGGILRDDSSQVIVPGYARGFRTFSPMRNALKSSQSELSLPRVT